MAIWWAPGWWTSMWCEILITNIELASIDWAEKIYEASWNRQNKLASPASRTTHIIAARRRATHRYAPHRPAPHCAAPLRIATERNVLVSTR
jgi:hypothetical protein